ncbi:MAG: MFS transporter [Proteobacteria bacterium]|nr:MFS transporter [Pseudomonadota bacterium]
MSRLFHPAFPFKPARSPFFYGWVIAAVTTIGVVMSIPGQTMGVGVFTEFLINYTGLSRLQLSFTYMVGTIISSVVVISSGTLIDRFGTRLIMVGSSLGLALALLMLSSTGSLIGAMTMVIPSLSSSTISIAVMIFIFFWLRYFGQGMMTMVSRITLSKWFEVNRGFATGISGVLISFSFAGSPLLLNILIENRGWEDAAFFLALFCGVGMALAAWLFFRDNPEECGLKMDGKTDNKELPTVNPIERSSTLKEALMSYNFWIFNLGLCSHSLIVTGIVFHMSSIGNLVGLSRKDSFSIFLPMSIFSLITHFLSGWISDRVSLKYLLMVMMASGGLGSFGFLYFGHIWGRGLAIVNLGILGGLFGCLSVVAWPRFYGRKHLGAISGLSMGSMVFASAIGPPIFGIAENLEGNYQSAFVVCILISAVLFLASFKATSYLNRGA